MLKLLDEKSIDRTGVTNLIVTADLECSYILFYAIYIKWTKTAGVLGGTAKLQETIDGVNWTDIAGKTQAIADASSFITFQNTTEFCGRKIRIHVTINAGGTCDLYAYSFGKGA